MKEFLGKQVVVSCNNKVIKGLLIDVNDSLVEIKTQQNTNKVNINEIQNMEVEMDESFLPKKDVLNEKEMYSLFYDAFTIYGPTEEQFVQLVINALIKTTKEAQTVKIIVGSDDIFGAIGFTFARSIMRNAKKVYVEIQTEITSLKNTMHFQLLKNSKQENLIIADFIDENENETKYDTVLLAYNRNYKYDINKNTTARILIIDCPSTNPYTNYFAFGLGFLPDTSRVFKNNFYVIDTSFSSVLCKKHGIDNNFSSSLKKIRMN
ncbi:hypothetical protein EHP00_892 [Ecytonucleospora hepatopenaei]|uniref:DUF5096 domain-containing protein n=1 Tax=Ecytonucleospora hepatopenaei TaxID=646526 RepID=A0A1W0E3Y3_9MICR|nr:hypothetical protein EHP00_892 [Ecytonucleospora hepatopenaei]